MSTEPVAPVKAPRYVVAFDYLCVEVDGCTCGGGPADGSFAHEKGCGLEPVASIADVEAALSAHVVALPAREFSTDWDDEGEARR